MSETASFCSYCGREFKPGEDFCADCGAPKEGEGPQPAISEPPPGGPPGGPEAVLDVIPYLVEIKGFLGLGTKFMNLVVTTERLIFALMPDELFSEVSDIDIKVTEKAEEKGLDWREYIESHDFSSAPWRKYLAWQPEDIVKEHKGNFAFTFKDILTARLLLDKGSEGEVPYDVLVLEAGGKTWELNCAWGNGHHVRRALSEVIRLEVGEREISS
ncbi:MAG: zinc ribbon domain-containing protein [Candidatus Eremiobacteraeota bacterium]|nr:zinc ribbon domain-containing protein [Candidatus Eremiobacteraeota bacterium]